MNHSPSFTTDSQLDREVKDALLYDTLVLINLDACDRRRITKEERRMVKDRLQQIRRREDRWVNDAPRSNTHTFVGLCVSVCVFHRQVRGAAAEPGSHGGADGEVRGQSPERLQKDLPQRGG